MKFTYDAIARAVTFITRTRTRIVTGSTTWFERARGTYSVRAHPRVVTLRDRWTRNAKTRISKKDGIVFYGPLGSQKTLENFITLKKNNFATGFEFT